jgi:hypothetical protein
MDQNGLLHYSEVVLDIDHPKHRMQNFYAGGLKTLANTAIYIEIAVIKSTQIQIKVEQSK